MVIDHIHMIEGENCNRMSEFLTDYEIPKDLFYCTKNTELVSADIVSFFGPSQFALARPETREMAYNKLVKPRIDSTIIPTKKVFFKTEKKTVGAHLRKNIGIETVEEYLLGDGFEMVDMALLSLPEKIDYLQHVDTIVLTAGSGVQNLIFCSHTVKYICFYPPFHMVQGNFAGMNIPASHFSLHAIHPIYPELCFHNGYLETIFHIDGGRESPYNNVIKGEFYARNPTEFVGPQSCDIDFEKFKEFYKHFTQVLAERGL